MKDNLPVGAFVSNLPAPAKPQQKQLNSKDFDGFMQTFFPQASDAETRQRIASELNIVVKNTARPNGTIEEIGGRRKRTRRSR
jgi:hypothetical protein